MRLSGKSRSNQHLALGPETQSGEREGCGCQVRVEAINIWPWALKLKVESERDAAVGSPYSQIVNPKP